MYPKEYELKSPIELLILLTIKKENETYGSELIKKLDQFKEWTPTAGTVYPILERLTKRKFLEKIKTPEGDARKKTFYRLTKNGQRLLNNNIEILEISMNFFEKLFEIGNETIYDNIQFLNFIQNRFEKYLNLLQNKKFEASTELIFKLNQFYDFLKGELKKIEKKISNLKEEGRIVKVDIE